MKKLTINLLVSVLSLFIVSKLIDSMYIGSLKALILLSIVLGVLNFTVKPLMKLFSLPITFLTLGLFSLVINAVVLKLGFFLVADAYLNGFISAIGASILLSIANTMLSSLFD